MKRVVSQRGVYHLWAHQAQDYAKDSHGHVWFEGQKAYSYGTCIGRILQALNGERVYLLDNRRYTNATSKHQSMLRSSVSGLPNVFTSGVSTNSSAEEVLQDYYSRIEDCLGKAKRARRNKPYYEQIALELLSEAQSWARLWNLPVPEDMPDVRVKVEQFLVEREAENEAAGLAEQKQLAEREAQLLQMLPFWLRGERLQGLGQLSYFGNRFSLLPMAYLRLMPGNSELTETTHGAVVPTKHIRKAAPFILSLIEIGEEYRRNGHTIHLGPYPLNSIDAEGNVRAGCYVFTKEEVLRFAEVLANNPPAPSEEE